METVSRLLALEGSAGCVLLDIICAGCDDLLQSI